jgi:hypothetical protein
MLAVRGVWKRGNGWRRLEWGGVCGLVCQWPSLDCCEARGQWAGGLLLKTECGAVAMAEGPRTERAGGGPTPSQRQVILRSSPWIF